MHHTSIHSGGGWHSQMKLNLPEIQKKFPHRMIDPIIVYFSPTSSPSLSSSSCASLFFKVKVVPEFQFLRSHSLLCARASLECMIDREGISCVDLFQCGGATATWRTDGWRNFSTLSMFCCQPGINNVLWLFCHPECPRGLCWSTLEGFGLGTRVGCQ